MIVVFRRLRFVLNDVIDPVDKAIQTLKKKIDPAPHVSRPSIDSGVDFKEITEPTRTPPVSFGPPLHLHVCLHIQP